MNPAALHTALLDRPGPLPLSVQKHLLARAHSAGSSELYVDLARRADTDPDVRRDAIAGGNQPAEAAWLTSGHVAADEVAKAAGDRRVGIRTAVASVPGLPDEVYLQAAHDHHPKAVEALLDNASVGAELLFDIVAQACADATAVPLRKLLLQRSYPLPAVLAACPARHDELVEALLVHTPATNVALLFGDLPG